MPATPLTLVQFHTTEDIPNYSPFCVKAEVLLKMSGLPYEIEWLDDPRKTPKGKLPMMRDGDKVIADSEFIMRYLVDEKGVKFDEQLSPREKAQAHAFTKMIDERTYWVLVHDRWINDKNWPVTRDYWFGDLPFPLKGIITRLVRSSVTKASKGHGIGKHSHDDIYALAKSDFEAISNQLGENAFLFGDKPSTADAIAFGLLVNLVRGQLTNQVGEQLDFFPNLLAYVDRCMAQWYPEISASADMAAE